MDFVFDPSLVLYLPLYQLDGASFVSKDAYGHTCTVNGASWRPNGYYFDGNDYIRKAVANFRSSDETGTIIVWFKTAGAGYLLSSCDEATNNFYFALSINGGQLRVENNNNDVATDIKSDDTSFADGAWHQGVLVSSGTAYLMYVDGGVEAMTVGAGNDDGRWFADIDNRDSFVIGALWRSAHTGYLTGTIGEEIIYSRALTPQEILHNYLATKWRYR